MSDSMEDDETVSVDDETQPIPDLMLCQQVSFTPGRKMSWQDAMETDMLFEGHQDRELGEDEEDMQLVPPGLVAERVSSFEELADARSMQPAVVLQSSEGSRRVSEQPVEQEEEPERPQTAPSQHSSRPQSPQYEERVRSVSPPRKGSRSTPWIKCTRWDPMQETPLCWEPASFPFPYNFDKALRSRDTHWEKRGQLLDPADAVAFAAELAQRQKQQREAQNAGVKDDAQSVKSVHSKARSASRGRSKAGSPTRSRPTSAPPSTNPTGPQKRPSQGPEEPLYYPQVPAIRPKSAGSAIYAAGQQKKAGKHATVHVWTAKGMTEVKDSSTAKGPIAVRSHKRKDVGTDQHEETAGQQDSKLRQPTAADVAAKAALAAELHQRSFVDSAHKPTFYPGGLASPCSKQKQLLLAAKQLQQSNRGRARPWIFSMEKPPAVRKDFSPTRSVVSGEQQRECDEELQQSDSQQDGVVQHTTTVVSPRQPVSPRQQPEHAAVQKERPVWNAPSVAPSSPASPHTPSPTEHRPRSVSPAARAPQGPRVQSPRAKHPQVKSQRAVSSPRQEDQGPASEQGSVRRGSAVQHDIVKGPARGPAAHVTPFTGRMRFSLVKGELEGRSKRVSKPVTGQRRLSARSSLLLLTAVSTSNQSQPATDMHQHCKTAQPQHTTPSKLALDLSTVNGQKGPHNRVPPLLPGTPGRDPERLLSALEKEQATRGWLESFGLSVPPSGQLIADLFEDPLRNGSLFAQLADLLADASLYPTVPLKTVHDVAALVSNAISALSRCASCCPTKPPSLAMLDSLVLPILMGNQDATFGLLTHLRHHWQVPPRVNAGPPQGAPRTPNAAAESSKQPTVSARSSRQYSRQQSHRSATAAAPNMAPSPFVTSTAAALASAPSFRRSISAKSAKQKHDSATTDTPRDMADSAGPSQGPYGVPEGAPADRKPSIDSQCAAGMLLRAVQNAVDRSSDGAVQQHISSSHTSNQQCSSQQEAAEVPCSRSSSDGSWGGPSRTLSAQQNAHYEGSSESSPRSIRRTTNSQLSGKRSPRSQKRATTSSHGAFDTERSPRSATASSHGTFSTKSSSRDAASAGNSHNASGRCSPKSAVQHSGCSSQRNSGAASPARNTGRKSSSRGFSSASGEGNGVQAANSNRIVSKSMSSGAFSGGVQVSVDAQGINMRPSNLFSRSLSGAGAHQAAVATNAGSDTGNAFSRSVSGEGATKAASFRPSEAASSPKSASQRTSRSSAVGRGYKSMGKSTSGHITASDDVEGDVEGDLYQAQPRRAAVVSTVVASTARKASRASSMPAVAVRRVSDRESAGDSRQYGKSSSMPVGPGAPGGAPQGGPVGLRNSRCASLRSWLSDLGIDVDDDLELEVACSNGVLLAQLVKILYRDPHQPGLIGMVWKPKSRAQALNNITLALQQLQAHPTVPLTHLWRRVELVDAAEGVALLVLDDARKGMAKSGSRVAPSCHAQ